MRAAQLLLCLPSWLLAQSYVISTVAGTGHLSFSGAGGPALNARLIEPNYVAADSAGNIYVSDSYYSQVFRIDHNGVISVYAGTGTAGFSGDNGPATAARLSNPQGLALDSANNLYIADGNRVRKMTPGGQISTVAGNGQGGVAGDGGSATSAAVGGATGVAVDAAGNLYISSSQNVIRQVTPDGTIHTIAGTGKPGFSGDGGQATAAMLFGPQGIKVDASGNLYVADTNNFRIRKISQGVINTIAGNGNNTRGDGQQATTASLFLPVDVALDSSGDVFISDNIDGRIRMVNPAGIISTFAGSGSSFGNGAPTQALLLNPTGITVDNSGSVIVAVYALRQVRRITAQAITTIAGVLPSAAAGDNVPANTAPLLDPYGVAVDGAGNVYVSDMIDYRIRKVAASSGIITTVAGDGVDNTSGDGGSAANAEIALPRGISFDPGGNLYIASGCACIRQIAPNGAISTIAGVGTGVGYSGDGGPAVAAQFLRPLDAVADGAGNVFIADSGNNRIRRINSAQTITTYAGTGVAGFGGDNGPATAAQLFFPSQLAVDGSGNLYIADTSNYRIREITPAGIISTVAGTGVQGFSGDGGAATGAQLSFPTGIAVDAAGNLFIGDSTRIRRVDAGTGTISTIAGTGAAGYAGDNGPAMSASLSLPQNIAIDNAGNIYFADENNARVRKLTPQQIMASGVLNGASLLAGAVSPGEIVTINIAGVDPTQTGAQVLFDGRSAPLVSVQPAQLSAIVPYEVDGQTSTQIQIVAGAITTNTITVPVAATAPGIFTADASGQGQGAITNEDGSPNSPANPAARGSRVTIAATGEGQTSPPGVDGQTTPATAPAPVQQVSVQIAGMDAPLISAGGTPNQPAGYFQVVAQVPDGAAVGDAIPIVLTAGGVASQAGVTISVQ